MTGKRQYSRLEKAAYHEAGHAVVAWCYDQDLRGATIIPDDGTKAAGKTHSVFLGKDMLEGLDELATIHVRIDHAGVEAEAILTGRRDHRGAAGDYRDIDHILAYVTPMDGLFARQADTRKAFLDYCRLSARDCLREYWGAVEAVAAALLECQTLDGGEIRRICVEAAFGKTLTGQPDWLTKASMTGAVSARRFHVEENG